MKVEVIIISASSLFRHRRPTLPAGVGRRCFRDPPTARPPLGVERPDPRRGDGRQGSAASCAAGAPPDRAREDAVGTGHARARAITRGAGSSALEVPPPNAERGDPSPTEGPPRGPIRQRHLPAARPSLLGPTGCCRIDVSTDVDSRRTGCLDGHLRLALLGHLGGWPRVSMRPPRPDGVAIGRRRLGADPAPFARTVVFSMDGSPGSEADAPSRPTGRFVRRAGRAYRPRAIKARSESKSSGFTR